MALASESSAASGPHSPARLSSSAVAVSISECRAGAAPQMAAHSSVPTVM